MASSRQNNNEKKRLAFTMPWIIVILCCLTLSCCTPSSKLETSVSFYYWKTTFELSQEEKKALEQNHVTKLYVRYFDITIINGKPTPLSSIVFSDLPGDLTIVPVVYIKNEVMLQHQLDTRDLAQKVVSYINQVNEKYSIKNSEIQFDCDWTKASKENYFQFIDEIKKQGGKSLSATIRLHQIKYYRDTGVPGVDRGVLMYYNMGHIAGDSSNSIYERTTASRYLQSIKSYPLTLDIALPIFSWGIHIRDNKVIGLLGKVNKATFVYDPCFEMNASSFFCVAKKNAFKEGRYFQKGDKIKFEFIGTEGLEEMAIDLSERVNTKPRDVIFYDLDNFNLKHYDNEKVFQKISSVF